MNKNNSIKKCLRHIRWNKMYSIALDVFNDPQNIELFYNSKLIFC